MDWQEFKQNVKDAKLPYYLSDDNSNQIENMDYDYPSSKLTNQLSLKGFFLNRPSRKLLDVFKSDQNLSPQHAKTFIHKSSQHKTFYSGLGNMLQNFFEEGCGKTCKVNKKIKCSSLERVALDDLQVFSTFAYSIKKIKKTCDLNLWTLINELKEMYLIETQGSKQTFLLDIGRIMLHFIFSTISQLRFEQCRLILEKMIKLETFLSEAFAAQGKNINIKTTNQLAPIDDCDSPTSKIFNKAHDFLATAPDLQSQADEMINMISLKIFHNSDLSSDVRGRSSLVERRRGSQNSKSRQKTIKQIMNIISKMKYTVAQMGHFLHYEELSNRVTSILSKPQNKQKSEKNDYQDGLENLVTPNHSSLLINLITPNHASTLNSNQMSQKRDLSFADAIGSHSFSTKILSQNCVKDDIVSSKNLKNYFYFIQNFLDDFNADVVAKRSEHLEKYCKWKAKKWTVNRKREKVEQKYEQYTIVCKICAQKFHVDKMMEHTRLCRKRGELDKELKEFDDKMSEIIFKAVLGSKELNTKFVVTNKKYLKLKEKIHKEVRQAGSRPGLKKKTTIIIRTENNSSVNSNNPSMPNSMVGSPNKESNESQFSFARSVTMKKATLLANFNLDLKKCASEEIQVQKTNSLTDRQQTDSSQVLETYDLTQLIHSRNRSKSPPYREKEEIKQPEPVIIENVPTRKGKMPTILLAQDALRRHSACSATGEAEYEENNTSTSDKKGRPFHLDMCVIRKGYKFPQGEDSKILDTEGSDREVHSARIHSARKGSTTSSHSDSSSQSSFELDDSPLEDLSTSQSQFESQKNKSSQYSKSSFFNLKAKFASNNSENKEELQQTLTNKDEENPYTMKILEKNLEDTESIKSYENEEPKTSMALRTVMKKPTLKKQDTNSSFSTETKMDTNTLEKMTKLRKETNKIKIILSLYDIIKSKGKSMLNQPPYMKSLELSIEGITEELEQLKTKIDDKNVVSLMDAFLNLIKDRLVAGKGIRDTKRELNKLDGIVEQEQEHKALERTYPLMKRSSLNLSKPNLFNSGKQIPRLSSSAFKLNGKRAAASNEIKEESVLNSSRLSQESIIIPGFEVSSFMNNEAGFLGSQSPAGNTPKDLAELAKMNIITSSVETSEDESDATSGNNSDRSDDGGYQVEQKPAEKEELKICDAFLDSFKVSPGRRDSKLADRKRDSSVMKSGKKPAIVIRDAEGKLRDSRNFGKPKKTVVFPQEKIESKELAIEKRTSTASSASEEDGTKDRSQRQKVSLSNFSFLKVPTANDTLSKRQDVSTNFDEIEEPKDFTRSRKKKHFTSIPNASNLLDLGFTQRLVITKDLTEGPKGVQNLHGTVFSQRKGRASSTEPIRDKKTQFSNQQKLLIVKDMDKPKPKLASQIVGDLKKEYPYKKSCSQMFIEDLLQDNENNNDFLEAREAPESLFLLDTVLERGYYSDSQVKRIKIPITVQPLIGMNDFEPLKMISKGAFGRVWLVRRKATNDLYALKVINLTEQFMKNKELENLRKENKVFGLAQEDFVVRAVFTFTFETCICFAMEYMIGGDFGDILYNYCALDEDVARFYIAEIVLAVDYLHSLGIVHRDLKPDNILLDKKGHAKLTDFGLSETGLSQKMKTKGAYVETNTYQGKIQAINQLCANMPDADDQINLKLKGKVMEKKFDSINKGTMDYKEYELESDEIMDVPNKSSNPSPRDSLTKKKGSRRHQRLIGTPDYMAPEIILGASTTSYSIDWWSLGVMLFEFLVGVPPFNDDTPEKIYDNIVNERVPWDQLSIGYEEGCISPEASDLIKKLLTLDHTKRLGSNGVAEIKQHVFFKGIDWENLRSKQPPIIPEHKDETDTTNFVRLAGVISDKEDFYSFVPKDKTGDAVRQYLESASESFNMFNIAALDSDNIKTIKEALQQRDADLKEFKKEGESPSNLRTNNFCDDVFDSPEYNKP